MKASDIPTAMPVPFAADAGAPYIRTVPIPSQINITAGAASFQTGFPPLTFSPKAAGGIPPFGQDFNGLLNAMSAWNRWQNAGGPVPWDPSFSSQVAGYPAGAIVASLTPGYWWLSAIDDNTDNPDDGGSNWTPVSLQGTATTGDQKFRMTAEDIPGWVKAQSGTVGDASSGANLASPITRAIFKWLWERFPNSQCPVTPGGRGANALADYAAHKMIATPDLRGTGVIGCDTAGTTFLSGVPAVFGSRTVPGSILGENLHILIEAENGPHDHDVVDPGHDHDVNDPGHDHAIADAGHVHSVADPGHNHGVTDPGHNHNIPGNTAGTPPGTVAAMGAGNSSTLLPTQSNSTGVSVDVHSTGVSVVSHTTGVTVDDDTTGITMDDAFTGITIQASGSGDAHNTVHRSAVGTWYLKL